MAKPGVYLKCICKNCGGHIEFPAEGAGQTVVCPHCNWSTVLTSSVPAADPVGGGPAVRKRIYEAFAIAAVVVIAGGAGVYRFWYLPKIHHGPVPAPDSLSQPGTDGIVKTNPVAPAVAPPDPWHGLMAGPVTLEKAADGHLVYAVGRLRNTSERQRFGVKVELDVFNVENNKVGTATDYTPSIDPGKEWKFKALVTDRAAKKAHLIAVKED